MDSNGQLKTRDFRISMKEKLKPNEDLMYIRFEGRVGSVTGKYVGSIHSKSEAKKLIEILKKAKFYR
jgi:hypothetical protein